ARARPGRAASLARLLAWCSSVRRLSACGNRAGVAGRGQEAAAAGQAACACSSEAGMTGLMATMNAGESMAGSCRNLLTAAVLARLAGPAAYSQTPESLPAA